MNPVPESEGSDTPHDISLSVDTAILRGSFCCRPTQTVNKMSDCPDTGLDTIQGYICHRGRIKMYKKAIAAISLLVMAILAASCGVLAEEPEVEDVEEIEAEKNVTFMFVQTAHSGTLVPIEGQENLFTLTLMGRRSSDDRLLGLAGDDRSAGTEAKIRDGPGVVVRHSTVEYSSTHVANGEC